MKLGKKILSIILAVALVLGTVAVAANAETALTQFEGSVQTYTFEVEGAENGVLTVKPGDTFNLKVYMETNYYVGSAGCELIIWTNNFFNTVSANDLTSSSFVTGWYLPTVTSPAQAAMIPTAYKTTHTGIYVGRAMNGGQTQAKALTTPELIYTIKFVVPETAVAGTTATILMPEGAIYTATNTRLGKIRQNISDNATTYGSTYASAYAQTVNVPTLTVKVASAVEYCDYAALETAVAKAPAMAADYYDAAAYKAWSDAKAAGQALLDAEALEKTDANQKTINDAAALVESTFAALVAQYVDLESLANAVADNKTPAYAEEYYEAAAYEAWEKAYAAAEAALTTYANAPATKQGEVNEINNDLVDAWNALVPVFVNLDKLNAAVEAYDELAYGKDYYDADLYAAWEAALADAKAAQTTYANAPVTKQAEVDAIADDLQAAFVALNPSILDLAALNNAIAASDETEYAAEYYDEAEYAAWEKALADAKAGVVTYTGAADTAANQAAVAALAKALTDAFAALDARFVDASAIDAAIDAYGATEYAAEYYDADEYAAYTAALAAAKDADFAGKADTAANQAAVAAIVADLKAAYEALDARFVSLDELNNAIFNYHELLDKEWYDADELAAWEAALDAAQAGKVTYAGAADTAENRAAVAKLAADLKAAYEELDPRAVDVSDLEAAIAESVPAYGEEYYDADAYADFTAAVDAGATIVAEMGNGYAPDTEENRATVAVAAQAIRDAYAALVPQFVSYEKLEAAIAEFGATPEVEFYYTPESYAAWLDAFAAAEEANNNRPEPLPAANEKSQAAIDALADALENAYNELEAAVCHVISVTPLQEVYDIGDKINFAVLVEGSAAKVQLIKESGVTSTYTRDHSLVVSVTDNGDGTETWIITRPIFEDVYTEYAKAKMGKNWDTGVVSYDLECKGEDADVKSVTVTLNDEVVDTVLRTDVPTLTIVTGPAAIRVRLIDPVTGGTLTYKTPTSVNEDGTKVWVIVKQYYQVKDYDLDVYVAGSAGYYDSGYDFELKVVDEIESQLPSTDKVEDAIFSATVAKTRLLRGATQTFTYTTDKDCKAVRILDANGKTLTTIKTAAVEGDVATWTFECSYSSIGDRSYTAEALYGETWIADADSAVSFTIVY